MRERYFTHAGVRYRVCEWDVGVTGAVQTRPLVLLHGFAQNADSWAEVVGCLAHPENLATDNAYISFSKVYALDFVGHGKSDKPQGGSPQGFQPQSDNLCSAQSQAQSFQCDTPQEANPYSMDVACAMLEEFLRAVCDENEGRAPVVVGYSMGGRIALAMLCRVLAKNGAPLAGGKLIAQGERPRKDKLAEEKHVLPLFALVLESAGLGPAAESDRTKVASVNAERAHTLRTRGIVEFMDAWERLPLFATQQALPEDVRARIREGRLANDAQALACTLEGTGAHLMPPQKVSLAVIDALLEQGIFVLYITGARDEKYRAIAQTLSSRRTAHTDNACITRIIKGAGHNTHLEKPQDFVNCLTNAF